MNSSSSPLSSKQMTPKRKSSKKSLKSTPNKSRMTPLKTRSPRSPRTLPISPISQTMRQSTIQDFFKPVSPSIESIESLPSIDIKSKSSKKRNIPLSPIFGSVKRNSVLKLDSNILIKKLKSNEVNDSHNNSEVNENLNNCNDMSDFSTTDQTLYTTANDISFESQVIKESCHQVLDDLRIQQKTDQNIDKSINQMMDCMKISENEKLSDNDLQKVEIFSNNNRELETDSECDKKVLDKRQKVLDKKQSLSSDDEMEIPIFKVPKSPIVLKIGFNKYVDKEKRNQTNYLLKNLKRINRDKQMLAIEPFADNHKKCSETQVNNEETDSSDYTKPVEGMDTFLEYIPNTSFISECSVKQTKYNHLSQTLQKLHKLPLNRLSTLIPIYITRLTETEREFLISHIIQLVSTEENILTLNKIEMKTIKILCGNELEIKLSSIVREFYHIIYTNCLNLQNDKKSTEKQIKTMSLSISNVLKMLSQVLNMCSFKFEAISIEEELIKLLLIALSLSLENRLITDYNWFYTLQQLIAVIMKNILLNESNISQIIETLLSFIKSNESINIGLSHRIVSMIPLNVDFDLKRQFCISVINLFQSQDSLNSEQTLVFSLNDIPIILTRINWKNLSPHQIHGIIQLISLSLDLPKDLIEYKDTVSQILNHLTFEINKSIPNASHFKYSDIHQLLVVLRSKVLASS